MCLATDELVKVHKYKPTAQWRQKFDNYLKTMPVYYAQVGSRYIVTVWEQIQEWSMTWHTCTCTYI